MKNQGTVISDPASRGAGPSSILVVGLGNPILGDDGAGWRVAEAVKAKLGENLKGIEVDCASLGGLSLMERLLGYARVILVDTMQSGSAAEGTVSALSLGDLPNPEAGHTASAHDASLMTALEAARVMGANVPSRIDVVVIEARRSMDFSDVLTPAVEAAVTIATRKVLDLLEREPDS